MGLDVLSVLGKARKILGKLTDALLKGRAAGLWSEKDNVNKEKR
jgi:hypothetical protein